MSKSKRRLELGLIWHLNKQQNFYREVTKKEKGIQTLKVANMLLLCYKVVSDSFVTHGLQPTRLLCPVGFPRQEYQSGLPFPSLGDLPNLRIEPSSPVLAGGLFTTEPLEKSDQLKESKYMGKLVVDKGQLVRFVCLNSFLVSSCLQ